ncbi:MAG: hypothetical protein H6Q77_1773 [Gemmatimonadetes bacterium]|nr:hypothetical protein [Gemmatimonadota bacterium]
MNGMKARCHTMGSMTWGHTGHPSARLSRLLLSVIAVIALSGTARGPLAAQSCPRDTTTPQALRDAMHEALLAPGGAYSILATTNSMRFQSAVFQRLIERALENRPGGGMLFIPYDAHWWEFLNAAGLGEGEADKAPIGRRLAYEYHQDIELLYGPPNSVVKQVREGPAPLIAANVRLAWPDRPDNVRKFSFEDTLSVPKLKATNHQLMTFRFLVFTDMIVLDDIEGISGRPLNGVLGTIFKVIGEGNARYARFSISTDGRQVMRTKATKVISKTVTATINPDGTGQNGVPDGRADMVAIEARLEQPLELEYFPYRCW